MKKIFKIMAMFALMILCASNILAKGENLLYIENFSINSGESKEIAIKLNNDVAFSGFQVDISLPEGLEVNQEDGEYIFDLSDRKGRDHILSAEKQVAGAIRLLCYSMSLKEFSGSSGDLVYFTVTASKDFNGDYSILLSEITLAQKDKTEFNLNPYSVSVTGITLAESISLDITEYTLEATETVELTASVLPELTTDKSVVWTSSDESVAKVDATGVVTAIAVGEATITATTADGTNLSATCRIIVEPTLGDVNDDFGINVTDVITTASYILGRPTLKFIFEAADVTLDKKINITDIIGIADIILKDQPPTPLRPKSENIPNKVKVSVRASGNSFYIEDFSIKAGETKEIAINLSNDVPFSGFQADIYIPDGLEVYQEDGEYIFDLSDRKGRDHTISAAPQADGSIRILCYSINLREFSDTSGELVYFKVTASEDFIGTHEIIIENITFTQANQIEYNLDSTSATITATPKDVLAESISLNETEITLLADEMLALQAIVMPETATNKAVEWQSSNEDVAVVSQNGVVAAVGRGTAVITATTLDGTNLSASCSVIVKAMTAPVNDVVESGVNGYVDYNEAVHSWAESFPFTVYTSENNNAAFTAELSSLPVGFTSFEAIVNEAAVAELVSDDNQHFKGQTYEEYADHAVVQFRFRIAYGTTSIETETFEYQIAGDKLVKIDNVVADDFSVKVEGDDIVVCDAAIGSQVSVYGIDGQMVASKEVADTRTIITAPIKGIYLVKVGAKTMKVFVK